ncbi:ABC transporter ATP-binding protein [Tepiditoga spiralis]|uniref:ABC transporter ATP-binding protein n=1 Tax=Tepiditoga spiralis TaxID=2108365 RepID=A0A7G1G4M5_9BACT|nr:ABC transporter ATP-binding protein [Tepiditoga spiralis]BBE31470.1 ABC transporter ATP-binding protein [Tepiditoga spiralis]
MSLIEVKSLKKMYKFGKRTLKKISFNIEEGEILSIIGPNGAGKTTILKSLLKLIKSGGEIKYKNNKITENDIINDFSYLPEDKVLYENYTPNEFIKLINNIDKKFNLKKALEYLDNFKIDKNIKLKKMSAGKKVLFYFIITISRNSNVYLFDEPTIFLDSITKKKILEEILKLSYDNKTIIFTTQILSEVEFISSKVLILNNGKIVEFDYIDKIKSRYIGLLTSNDLKDFISKKNIVNNEYLYIVDKKKYDTSLFKTEDLTFETIYEELIGGHENV